MGCTLDQPLHVVTEASVPAANSEKDSESPGTLLPPALSLAIPRALGRSKAYLLAEFASTVAEQAWRNSTPEKPRIQERRVWKREREKFILGASSQGR